MHTLILGKRNSIAQSRILNSSALLAQHFGIDAVLVSALTVQEKDAVVKAMKEREAVANLLDAIAINVGVLIKPADVELESVSAVTAEDLPEPVIEEDAADLVEAEAEPKPKVKNKRA